MKKYFSKLNNRIRDFLKWAFLIICIILVIIISNVFLYFYNGHNIVCAFIYNIINNKSLIGWFSGLGSLSAALVALWVSIPSEQKFMPLIKPNDCYYDAQYKELIIQFINTSQARGFIKLYGIGFSNKKDYIQCNRTIPYRLRKYEWLHKVLGENVFTIEMKNETLELPENHFLIDDFLSSGEKYIVFKFEEFRDGTIDDKFEYVSISRQAIIKCAEEYQNILNNK